ncbi:MAG: hypothetical protein HZB85_03120 [Deltaproteobacteria bacterium]|nr:hypothetical protein [Deltaproteobacteria bacterium]
MAIYGFSMPHQPFFTSAIINECIVYKGGVIDGQKIVDIGKTHVILQWKDKNRHLDVNAGLVSGNGWLFTIEVRDAGILDALRALPNRRISIFSRPYRSLKTVLQRPGTKNCLFS